MLDTAKTHKFCINNLLDFSLTMALLHLYSRNEIFCVNSARVYILLRFVYTNQLQNNRLYDLIYSSIFIFTVLPKVL